MVAATSKRWVIAVVLVGVIYLVAGVGFAALAKGAASHRMVVAWRLAAWLTSAVAFAAHIGYERLRLGHSRTVTALHASLAAALGACALAAAAMVHAVSSGAGNRRLLAIALVAWPAVTALPAFLVALAVAAVLGRKRQGAAARVSAGRGDSRP